MDRDFSTEGRSECKHADNSTRVLTPAETMPLRRETNRLGRGVCPPARRAAWRPCSLWPSPRSLPYPLRPRRRPASAGARRRCATGSLISISGVTDCANVTDAHLAAITGTLDLKFDQNITALVGGRFRRADRADGGWIWTTTLADHASRRGVRRATPRCESAVSGLPTNCWTTLPAGVFDGQHRAASTLELNNNSLSTLPAGVFDELDACWGGLDLNDNSLTALPAGVFDNGLTALDDAGSGPQLSDHA